MNWQLLAAIFAVLGMYAGPDASLPAWQSVPEPNASQEEIVDFYQQAYGDPTRLEQLTALHLQWEVRARDSQDRRRDEDRAPLAEIEFIWTPANWAERSGPQLAGNCP